MIVRRIGIGMAAKDRSRRAGDPASVTGVATDRSTDVSISVSTGGERA
jgi:hypothetical protein